MVKYVNKDGEEINVSQEHLDTSVKIKVELQKENNGMRCNWKRHKKMMEQEGFDDSEVSENYRLMIKNYQASTGTLEKKEVIQGKILTSKLESLKEAVGELHYTKKEIQHESSKLGKLKKDLSLFGIVSEEILNGLNDIKIQPLVKDYPRFEESENKLIVACSDWHIGLKTDRFNYEVAKEKVSTYVLKVIEHCVNFNVTDVYLVGIGDLVENVYMRTTQAYNVEFVFSEQITKASQLFMSMIVELSKYVNVHYLGIVEGNHDRMFIKGQTLENDSAMRIVDFYVTDRIENDLELERVTIEKDGYNSSSIKLKLNDFLFKFVHGDKEPKAGNKVLKHSSVDNVNYDAVVHGHFHNFNVIEENNGKTSVTLGCLPESSTYSKDLGYNTIASQGVILVTPNDFIPIRVGL